MRSSSILPKIVKVGSLVGYSCSSQLLLLTVSIPRAPQHNGHKRLFVFSPLGLPGVSSIVPPSSDVLRLLHVTSCRIIFLDPMSPALRPPAFSFLRFYIFTPPGVGLPPSLPDPCDDHRGPSVGTFGQRASGLLKRLVANARLFLLLLETLDVKSCRAKCPTMCPNPQLHIYIFMLTRFIFHLFLLSESWF